MLVYLLIQFIINHYKQFTEIILRYLLNILQLKHLKQIHKQKLSEST